MLRNDIKQVICSFASELDFILKKEDLKEEKPDLFIPEKLILLFKKLKWYSFLIHHTIRMY